MIPGRVDWKLCTKQKEDQHTYAGWLVLLLCSKQSSQKPWIAIYTACNNDSAHETTYRCDDR